MGRKESDVEWKGGRGFVGRERDSERFTVLGRQPLAVAATRRLAGAISWRKNLDITQNGRKGE